MKLKSMNYGELAIAIADAYKEAFALHLSCTTTPGDIGYSLTNARGFLQRIPGQEYFREPPVGAPTDAPSHDEVRAGISTLRIFARRLRLQIDTEEAEHLAGMETER